MDGEPESPGRNGQVGDGGEGNLAEERWEPAAAWVRVEANH